MRILANERLEHDGVEVKLYLEHYIPSGVIALELTCESDYDGTRVEEPYARLTCNLPQDPPLHCVWLKEWSENEWVYQWCVDNGLIEPKAVDQARSGFVVVKAYRLSDKVQRGIVRAAIAEKKKVRP